MNQVHLHFEQEPAGRGTQTELMFQAPLWALLPLLLTLHSASACGTGGSATVTNLPTAGGYAFQVNGLNAAGQLTGYYYGANVSNPEAFLYSNGTVTDLGNLGGPLSEGIAINRNGAVAGASYLADYEFDAFLFQGAGLVDLGTLGGTFTIPYALNDSGQVVGGGYTTGNAALQAFLYTGNGITNLGTLGGGYSVAYTINSLGSVGGESSLASGDVHGFVYTNGAMLDVGTLGGNYSSVFALNDAGVAVGQSTLPDGQYHGFVYVGNAMTDVGTFGGTNSSAFTVNREGQVIGVATTANEAQSHGFLYFNGTLTDLGTLGGDNSYVYAINNAGQIVGYSSLADGTVHAFLWQNGQMVDLNSLLPAGSGWELQIAQFINDAGRIVGTGTLNGVSQPFILDLAAANSAPVANAGANQVVECASQAMLDGSASSDPDGDALTFLWSLDGAVLGTNATLTVSLPLGTNVVTLQVTDPCGASAQATVTVRVVDTLPPVVSCPPSASAAAGADCQAPVPNLVAQTQAYDVCAGNALVLAQDPAPGTPVGLGQHTVTVTATDPSGNSASCQSTFTVADVTPPSIQSVTATPNVLYPPNHQMVPVTVSVSAADNCDPAPSSSIVSVSCSEPPAPGDIQVTGPLTVNLAASKNAGGATRLYTIVVQCRDASGNQATSSVVVTVPSNNGGGGSAGNNKKVLH
jgi:probable HAF family extracellular repeat protein